MSPPGVWGPAVWTLFHTLIAKINEDAYSRVSPGMFNTIVRICKFLPCPDCSAHASTFLAKVNPQTLKTKTDFKNTFFWFHNSVNHRKNKGHFNYHQLEVYNNYHLIGVVNNFIGKYNTKGNMKLLAESFQRQMVIKQFKSWFTGSIRAFIPVVPVPKQLPISIINDIPQVQISCEEISCAEISCAEISCEETNDIPQVQVSCDPQLAQEGI